MYEIMKNTHRTFLAGILERKRALADFGVDKLRWIKRYCHGFKVVSTS
jgi:hypothetical protein